MEIGRIGRIRRIINKFAYSAYMAYWAYNKIKMQEVKNGEILRWLGCRGMALF